MGCRKGRTAVCRTHQIRHRGYQVKTDSGYIFHFKVLNTKTAKGGKKKPPVTFTSYYQNQLHFGRFAPLHSPQISHNSSFSLSGCSPSGCSPSGCSPSGCSPSGCSPSGCSPSDCSPSGCSAFPCASPPLVFIATNSIFLSYTEESHLIIVLISTWSLFPVPSGLVYHVDFC